MKSGSRVLMFAEASVDWYLCQYGAILVGLVVVPILDATPIQQLEEIIAKCSPSVILVSKKTFQVALNIKVICKYFHTLIFL